MRGVTIQGKCRGVERATGCEIEIIWDNHDVIAFVAKDPELGREFTVQVEHRSERERQLSKLHETVYHARGAEKYRQQGGKCAMCNRELNGSYDIDHIRSRGAHGRDDRMENIRCLGNAFKCSCHRQRHGG